MKWIALVAVMLLCGIDAFAERPSKLFEVQSGPGLGKSPEIESRTPVFVLYIADTRAAFTSNYQDHLQRLLQALQAPESDLPSNDSAFLARVREFILYDLELTRRSSELETAALKRELCFSNGKLPFNFILFHNSSNAVTFDDNGFDLYSSYEICRPENPQEGTFRRNWKIENLGAVLKDAKWEDQFLTYPLVFERAIIAVQKEFPPDKYRYLLMIKGRGDADYLLKAQYAFDTSKLEAKRIRQAFLDRAKDFGQGPQFTFELEYSALVQGILAELLPPLSDDLAGISKWSALEIIAEKGGGDTLKGAYFSQVIFNSLGAPLERSSELKPFVTETDYSGLNIHNVGGIRHFGTTGADPKIPFEKLNIFFGPPKNFEERLNIFLEELRLGKGKQ